MVLFIFMRFHINIPGPGTELRILTARVLFSVSRPSQLVGLLIDKLQHISNGIGSMFA